MCRLYAIYACAKNSVQSQNRFVDNFMANRHIICKTSYSSDYTKNQANLEYSCREYYNVFASCCCIYSTGPVGIFWYLFLLNSYYGGKKAGGETSIAFWGRHALFYCMTSATTNSRPPGDRRSKNSHGVSFESKISLYSRLTLTIPIPTCPLSP